MSIPVLKMLKIGGEISVLNARKHRVSLSPRLTCGTQKMLAIGLWHTPGHFYLTLDLSQEFQEDRLALRLCSRSSFREEMEGGDSLGPWRRSWLPGREHQRWGIAGQGAGGYEVLQTLGCSAESG